MNIIVKPYGKDRCYCRPDTTWERENKDFYVPDGIRQMYWAPVVFARICKAGKCIGRKFAERYYDSFNYGALLYAGNEEIAFSSCADHTSLLPFPLSGLEEMGNGFIAAKNGEPIFSMENIEDTGNRLEEAICDASALTSLRIGDLVAVELAPIDCIASNEEKDVHLKLESGEKTFYDIRLIF